MVFDPSSAIHLKPWLVRALEPICDAEPGALADYILALLKHNVPEAEMRKEMQVQLEEFLENECAPFLDTLFTVLRTKSYLPYATEPAPSTSRDEGIPIPLDEIMASSSSGGSGNDRTRKRSMGDDGDARPIKGARLSTDGDFSRYGNGGQWAGQPGMGGFGMGMPGMGMGMQNGRQQAYRPPGQPKRGICRDYHNHGFCARGETCKYSHGDDAVIPSQLYPMVPPPMMPFFYNMFGQGGAPYDPNERIDTRGGRPGQRAPVIPRGQQEQHTNATGELPVIQDLTPQGEGSKPKGSQQEQQSQHQQQGMVMPPPHALAAMMQGFDPSMFAGGAPNMAGMPFPLPGMDPNAQPQAEGSNHPGQPSFRGRGGRPPRGRGGASDASSFRPGQRGDKTLVVEKIPEDKLSLDQITTWFKKFGDVTNVAVDPHGAKALVSFATHDEARAAWKSEDAVFNNRFVKVFWHRPMEGHGQVGQRALAASANLVSNLAGKATTGSTPGSSQAGPSSSAPAKKQGAPSAAATALAAKQELLEKHITEQKSLMEELSSATAERRKEIMARLRKINEEMSAAKDAVTSATATPSKKSTTESASKEASSEAALDKDTEMQAADGGEETTEQLKAKLERLKAEAASLGISPDAPAESTYGGYRGGYRGRGRARGGYYRGAAPVMRGGPPRGSLKLDNRPKKLLVKGVDEDSGKQTVREWYEALGQVENIENLDSGDVLVSFKSRAAAEQGLAKGQHIPGLGKVQVSWHTAKPSTPTSASAPVASSSSMQVDKEIDHVATRDTSPSRDDEEPVATGWGEDDGMGF
ncbi:RRM domain-containing protein [Coprinopsis sp. MPI-PUGE-AT-0042]|nr:RRM domain-containing protein [Coprinopsis sp. MPI-PUGE-AT-0042]